MSTQHTMKRSLLLLLLAVVVVFAGTQAHSTLPLHRYYAGLYPVSLPKNGGVAVMELRIWEDSLSYQTFGNCCDGESWREIRVMVQDDLTYNATLLRDTPWVIQLDDDHSYKELLEIELSPNDTCRMRLIMHNVKGGRFGTTVFWVTRPDTTEIWYSYPGPRLADRLNRKPDTTLYRAWIDLSDPRRRQVFFEEFEAVEQKYGTPVPVGDSGIYHFRATRDDIRSLIRERWRAGYIDTPPPMPDLPAGCSVKVETGPRRPPVQNPRRPRPTSTEDSSQGSSPVR